MQTRVLGATKLAVSAIGLGTWQLSGDAHGPPPPGSQADIDLALEADRTIARARALGVTLFEVSDAYGVREGVGRAPHETVERRLGRLLEGDGDVVIVARGGNDLSANPARKRFDRDHLRMSAARTAERLRRRPDVYLLDHPQLETVQHGEATGALEELVKEGVIAHWGVACGDGDVAQAALDAKASVLEVAYNALRSRELHSLSADIRANDTGVLARSTLAYGLLCGTWSPERAFPEGDHRRDRWTRAELTERLRQVAAFRPLVKDDIHTLRAFALRYVLANGIVSAAVVGARTQVQLEQDVRAIGEGPPYLPMEALSEMPNFEAFIG
ncbi:MAG: aldo/keto reductase [Polyangiales bacterium]